MKVDDHFTYSKKDIKIIRKYMNEHKDPDAMVLEKFIVQCIGKMIYPKDKLEELKNGINKDSSESLSDLNDFLKTQLDDETANAMADYIKQEDKKNGK